jgi:hypothetical protein
MKQWREFAGNRTLVPLNDVIQGLVPHDCDGITQLRINIGHLLAHELNSYEIMSGTIPFEAFMNFFDRYGSSTGGVAHLAMLTPQRTSMNFDKPVFYVGICLGADRRALTEAWSKASVDSWALIEGKSQGTFQLLVKRKPVDREDCRISISVNPTSVNDRFIVDGEQHGLFDFNALLNHLRLMKESGLRLPDWQAILQEEWNFDMMGGEDLMTRLEPNHWSFFDDGALMEWPKK